MAHQTGQLEGGVLLENRISTVFALLPTSVQSRIHPLRQIRRAISLNSISSVAGFPSYGGTTNNAENQDSGLEDGQITPLHLTEPTISEPVSDAGESDFEDGLEKRRMRMVRGREVGGRQQQQQLVAPVMNVRRRFAQQGANLVSVSLASENLPLEPREAAFRRETYVDGLVYLLQGLPQELSPHESERLIRSLPTGLAADLSRSQGHGQDVSPPAGRGSLLYRMTTIAVSTGILIFSLLLPFLLFLLQQGSRLERRYGISETITRHGTAIGARVVNRGVRVAELAWNGTSQDAGIQLLGVAGWACDEVGRGIVDGLDRGFSGVKVREAPL